MGRIEITAQGQTYSVLAESGLIKNAGAYLTSFSGKKAAVITDENVFALYAKPLEQSLLKAGITPVTLTVPAGEESKRHAVLLTLYGELLANGITRSDCVIALGGGVVGDLAGFAAATYLRGVSMIQIPTTLLAQVDSSVGGKVAVNLPQGKNLIGTFCQPSLVLADLDALKTLDGRQLRAGLAEIVKYGAIADRGLLDEVAKNPLEAQNLNKHVLRCCEIKATFVEQDPLDKGVRMLLNFGHTLGHAVEACAGYGTVLHGEGVSIGMVAAAKWGEALGISPAGTANTLQALLTKLDLPTEIPQGLLEAIIQRVSGDKKAEGGDINVILLKSIGEAKVERMSKQSFTALIRRCAHERG